MTICQELCQELVLIGHSVVACSVMWVCSSWQTVPRHDSELNFEACTPAN